MALDVPKGLRRQQTERDQRQFEAALLEDWGFDEVPEFTSPVGSSAIGSDAEVDSMKVVEVHPDNEPAVSVFLGCWRHFELVLGGMGGAHWRAVPPSEVRQVMKWLGFKRKRQGSLWQQYTVMEQEALRLMNEREARAADRAATA